MSDRFCRNCGTKINDGAIFCIGCGKKIEIMKKQERICDCGRVLDEGTRFCPDCGRSDGSGNDKLTEDAPKIQNKVEFCPDCGRRIADGITFCPDCGRTVDRSGQYGTYTQSTGTGQRGYTDSGSPGQQYTYQPYQQPPVDDSGSFGWFILGFLIPIVGLILFIVWSGNKPKCARMSGLGALTSVIIGLVIPIMFIFLIPLMSG